jgi:4-amino-4-deoxy-L-arabinose transferase-like glycosyltransferase
MTWLSKRADIVWPLVLVAIVLLLFVTGAPTDDAFSWPDSPRHALNGAFLLDFARDHPLRDPTGYAYNYYAQYPALTILFYPPLFYVLLAIFYALFGVSQTAAIAAECFCYAALAIGSYRLARFWLGALPAFGAALILIAAPEIAYWGRQVMLEIPSFALLVWSAVCFMRYQRDQRIGWLYLAAALAVLAAYTKLTAIFILLVYFLLLLHRQGARLFRNKHSYIVALLAIVGLVPLAVLTLKFGQANMQSVSGISDSEVSRATLAGWLWYAKQMPAQLGWPALAAALIGLGTIILPPARLREYLPLILWLAIGYLFFSAIDLKEARHSLFLLIPLTIFAASGLTLLLRGQPLLAGSVVVAIGVFTLGWTMHARPVQYVAGYRELSDYVAQVAPKNAVVVFSGYRDGSFIYAMRTHEERRDISIVRSDKLLLRIAVRRSLGVEQKLMREDEIQSMLDGLGVRYVAAQPEFWTDLEAMKRFENVLHSSHFQKLRTFPMRANYHAQENEIIVYKNLDRVSDKPRQLNIELPMIGKKISGTVGQAPAK